MLFKMWLINVETHELERFNSEDTAPNYAILSHTWEESGEVTYQDWHNRSSTAIRDKSGFIKIITFCDKVKGQYEYVWVDT